MIAVSWYAWLAFRIRVNMSAIGSVMVMSLGFYFLGVVSVRTCSVLMALSSMTLSSMALSSMALSGLGAAVLASGADEPRRPVLLSGTAQGRPCRVRPFAPIAARMRDESSIGDHHDDFVIPGNSPLCASSRRQMRHRPNLR
jgi:hypothetical protein